jgi:molybdenum cofactor cytidylyltransferase
VQEQKKLSTIFQEQPARWGLRGDPHLWSEMKERLAEHTFPSTEEQFVALIEQTYEALTGAPLARREPTFIERFSHGGMSSGYVSPQFWADTALPMLREGYRGSKC